jgi:Mrp family chromosome partitioning ATPase
MSDIALATPNEAAIEILREREVELVERLRVDEALLNEVRNLMTTLRSRRPRAIRKLRTPAERIAAALAEPAPAASTLTRSLDAALASLGRAVAASDAELAAA